MVNYDFLDYEENLRSMNHLENLRSMNHLENLIRQIGIFLENDFWTPPLRPPPLLSILYMDLIC